MAQNESLETAIARLEEQYKSITGLLSETRDELMTMRKIFEDGGCFFGRVLKNEVDRLKLDIQGEYGLKKRVDEVERTHLTWSAKSGGAIVVLSVLGNVIAWGVAIWAVVWK